MPVNEQWRNDRREEKLNDEPPLTPENSALLLIDHQVGTNFVYGAQTDLEFRNAVRALAKWAKNYDIPTVITDSFPQGPNGYTMSWIASQFPDNEVIHRQGGMSRSLLNFVERRYRVERYAALDAGATNFSAFRR